MSDSDCLVKLIAVVFIVFLFLWYIYASSKTMETNPNETNRRKVEKFEDAGGNCCNKVSFKKQNNQCKLEYSQKPIPTIYSPLHVTDTDSIIAGIDIVPQSEFLTPQNELVNVKTSKDGKLGYCNDPNGIGDNGLNFNFCSPACCSNQYPLPFKLPVQTSLYYSDDEYVPTSYMCSDGVNNSGCLCLKKSQANFLNSRGLNAYS
jgi:hypothetical protein